MKKNIGKYQKNLTKWELGKVQQMLERELIIKAMVWKYMISENAARRMYDETDDSNRDNLRKLAENYKASARMSFFC